MKQLSIIVPIYNMERYLPKCLASFERQKFDDTVEIILVDDGSSDSSLSLCKKAFDRDNHYRVIHQENQGVSGARNTGLTSAVGEYVAWVDPDDYITDNWWSTVQNELSSSPDMIYFDMYILKDGILKEVNFDMYSRIISSQELYKELAIGTRIQSHLWSKIIRRTFFDQLFSNKYSYCEDFALLHHVVWKVQLCRYIHKPLYVYRQLTTSIVHNEEKILSNCLIGIKLYKHRYRFFTKKKINVPYDGVWLAMLNYCYEYKKRSRNATCNHYKRIYEICIGVLRNKYLKIMCAKDLGYKEKIKFTVACLRCIKLFLVIKKYK